MVPQPDDNPTSIRLMPEDAALPVVATSPLTGAAASAQ